MKKLLLFFSVALLCVSCKSHKWDGERPCYWQIANGTEQTLVLKCPYSESFLKSDLEYMESEVKPGDIVIICSGKINVREEDVHFDYYFKKCADEFGENVCWQILSEDNVILKTWNYSDIGKPDQRFFEESSWDYFPGDGEWFALHINRWTFEIIPEDIVSE